MVQQLLAFGRKQLLQLEVLDLNAVVSEDLAMLRRLIGEDIELETSLHHPSPLVRADRVQLRQVLFILAVNARDAMPSGGTLLVWTSGSVCEAACPSLCKEVAPGRYAVLSVSDTGIGMDDGTRKKLFEHLFTTRGAGKRLRIGAF